MPPAVAGHSQTLVSRIKAENAFPYEAGFVARLAQEFEQSWQGKKGLRVEDVQARHPEIADQTEVVLRLILEETYQRRCQGEEPQLKEFVRRFPRWASHLVALWDSPQTHGGSLGRFQLVQKLGEGAEGQVYLARQTDLADRLVVLKMVRASVPEHLSLARLQHTNIVPLYGIHEDTSEARRVLCMPYFGSVTLKDLLERWANTESQKRNGADIVAFLDAKDQVAPANCHRDNAARLFLRGATQVQAACWMGACLADGLDHAHQRGLIHFDLKPSNILWAADGQPMLLDFHLARPALEKGSAPPGFFGGTAPYTAPEQETVFVDVSKSRKLSVSVDARTDLYALGMILYQMLANRLPRSGAKIAASLRLANPQVSVGLADVVEKCLAADANKRYGAAADLAQDLRLHLADQPLRHVRNRSLKERWHKWRRRRPRALAVVVLFLALGSLAGLVTHLVVGNIVERREVAESYLIAGQHQLRNSQYAQAVQSFENGLKSSETFGGNARLTTALKEHWRLARRFHQAGQLRELVDQLRVHAVSENTDKRALAFFEVNCQKAWRERHELLDPEHQADALLELEIRRDLIELAVGWAGIHVQLANATLLPKHRHEALAILKQAETMFSAPASPVLRWEEEALVLDGAAWRLSLEQAAANDEATNSWEHCCLARCLLRAGSLEAAALELTKALREAPTNYWINFYAGVCAQRESRWDHCVAAYSVCLGQSPKNEECFLRRGKAYQELRDWPAALRDFNSALKLRPNWTEALLQRGISYLELGQLKQAREDIAMILEMQPDNSWALLVLSQLDRK